MEHNQIEFAGKVFVVVSGKRKCLICDGVFTPTQAVNHAVTICFPTSTDSEQGEGIRFLSGLERDIAKCN